MAKTSTKISTIKTRVDAIAKLDLDNILFGALKGQRTEFADDIDHIISTLELVKKKLQSGEKDAIESLKADAGQNAWTELLARFGGDVNKALAAIQGLDAPQVSPSESTNDGVEDDFESDYPSDSDDVDGFKRDHDIQ